MSRPCEENSSKSSNEVLLPAIGERDHTGKQLQLDLVSIGRYVGIRRIECLPKEKRKVKIASMNKVAACSLLAAGLALLTVASYGQIPIKSVPLRITESGDYLVLGELVSSDPSLPAIEVDADHVTINFFYGGINGFGTATTAIGIKASNVRDLRVANGRIFGFFNGISIRNSSEIVIIDVRVEENLETAILLSDCTDSIIQKCIIGGRRFGSGPPSIGIDIAGGTAIKVENTDIFGPSGQRYEFGIRVGGTSKGNYLESDWLVNCDTALKLQPEDKYRAITTDDCPNGIVGGIDVDGMSN
jgi:hypothetical protein